MRGHATPGSLATCIRGAGWAGLACCALLRAGRPGRLAAQRRNAPPTARTAIARLCSGTARHGAEDAPELAELYLFYGKALLENAISQASVLGRDGGADEGGAAPAEGASARPPAARR